MKENELYYEALDRWGRNAEICLAIEECSELITKLIKYDREINGSTIEEIRDEIADVEIMMRQMEIIFGKVETLKIKQQKLERLAKRLGVEYG